jgi:RNA polymerase-binding transcription factor DksA
MKAEINVPEIRKALDLERQRLLDSASSGDGPDQLLLNPDHGDLARVYDTRQRNTVLESIIEEKLAQIEAAYVRLDSGTYGKCQKCAKQIHPERLRAIPYAELCVECQSRVKN